jgi:hypothetical protein
MEECMATTGLAFSVAVAAAAFLAFTALEAGATTEMKSSGVTRSAKPPPKASARAARNPTVRHTQRGTERRPVKVHVPKRSTVRGYDDGHMNPPGAGHWIGPTPVWIGGM